MQRIIHIVGLGPGHYQHLSAEAIDILCSEKPLFLRTEVHPAVEFLKSIGIDYCTYDHFYQEKDNFDEVYEEIVSALLNSVEELGEIVYAVPGHPWVAEKTVEILSKIADKNSIELRFISGISFLDLLFSALKFDPVQGVSVLDAHRIEDYRITPEIANVIVQVNHRFLASRVKLIFSEVLSAEKEMVIVKSLGIPGEEELRRVRLFELDHYDDFDHLTTIFVPPQEQHQISESDCSINKLREIMAKLRSEDGCLWDREQTHVSLKPYLIEEAYEVCEAINSGDKDALVEELGDVLLQVAFHSQIGSEKGDFDFDDVVAVIYEKMIRRHPHVFNDVIVKDTEEVLTNWDQIKRAEKGKERISVLDGIPKDLPALMKAFKLQSKAAKVGFDWDTVKGALEKVYEELNEVEEALDENMGDQVAEEVGDLLFAVVNVARFASVEPETALLNTVEKFYRRFRYIEESAKKAGNALEEMSLEEMDRFWEEAKNVGRDRDET